MYNKTFCRDHDKYPKQYFKLYTFPEIHHMTAYQQMTHTDHSNYFYALYMYSESKDAHLNIVQLFFASLLLI